jgi:hypothetical protein
LLKGRKVLGKATKNRTLILGVEGARMVLRGK